MTENSSLRLTTIFFDFFDVIRMDPYKKWLSDHGYTREGFWYDAAAQYDRGVIDRDEYIQMLSDKSGEPVDVINAAFASTNIFDDDVIEIITRLRESYQVGLISNSGGPGLRRVMASRDLEPLFHDIVISGEVGLIKPEPAIFELALARLGVQAEESLFTDDNPHNVSAAQEVGMDGIVFTSAAQLADVLASRGITLQL